MTAAKVIDVCIMSQKERSKTEGQNCVWLYDQQKLLQRGARSGKCHKVAVTFDAPRETAVRAIPQEMINLAPIVSSQ